METHPHRSDFIGEGGPLEPGLLRYQNIHRSDKIWDREKRKERGEIIENDKDEPLKVRRRKVNSVEVANEKFESYMRETGFWDIWRIGFMDDLDRFLVTALVERWRPETHTFHMPDGEMSITLQDVSVLLGLPIDGEPITGKQTPDNWLELCSILFGKSPDHRDVKGNEIRFNWLTLNFNPVDLKVDDTDETVKQYVRANVLRMIGSQLFSDTNDGYIHSCWLPFLKDVESIGKYSWGSACLSFLYKQMCIATKASKKEISGSIFFLCMWAWERILPCRPVFHEARHQEFGEALGIRWSGRINTRKSFTKITMPDMRKFIDELRPRDIVWRPYDFGVLDRLPNITQEVRDLWLARVPLISFHSVEWHYPDRVMRQFGLQQDIPRNPEPDDGIHTGERRGSMDRDWALHDAGHVSVWVNRRYYLVHGVAGDPYIHYHSGYMDWYRSASRRFISPAGAEKHVMVDTFERIRHLSQTEQLRGIAESALGVAEEQRRYLHMPESHQSHCVHFNAEYKIPEAELKPRPTRFKTIPKVRKPIERVDPIPCSTVLPPMDWNDYRSSREYCSPTSSFHPPYNRGTTHIDAGTNMAGTSSQSPMGFASFSQLNRASNPGTPSFHSLGDMSERCLGMLFGTDARIDAHHSEEVASRNNVDISEEVASRNNVHMDNSQVMAGNVDLQAPPVVPLRRSKRQPCPRQGCGTSKKQ